MSSESMKVSLIFIDNFPKELVEKNNEYFEISKEKDDKSSFERLKNNIELNKLYNIIYLAIKQLKMLTDYLNLL